MTKLQLFAFTLVVAIYMPCIATVVVLARELGWRKAAYITVFEIAFALLLGGIAFRLLTLA